MQAKTLTDKEVKIVLATISVNRHSARNRCMFLMSMWAGMRVAEIAALKISDVLASDGTIKDEIRLAAEQTKGDRGRLVLIGDKLKKELAAYVATLKHREPDRPFYQSQRNRSGFSANTLAQHFGMIYQRAGIDGASSHSGRRTFITTLANRGVSVRVLAGLAGHRSIMTTQRYIDLNEDMMKVAVNLI